MRAICQDYIGQNEYTIPLEGMPYYRSSGIIYAEDIDGNRYAVSKIIFERYDEQNFQYIFIPEWSVIDALPDTIFQGIPGLDMSLRLREYYRVNMTPYFISERTPSEGREDVWELLETVGLDYYDRFEWLLRTDMRCGTDNLIVDRAVPPRRIEWNEGEQLPIDLQPDDCVLIEGFDKLGSTSHRLRSYLLQMLRSGAKIWDRSEERMISDEESCTLLKFVLLQELMENEQNRKRHLAGVEKAKAEGKYLGRKRISVDHHLLRQVIKDFEAQRISETEAMRRVGITSRSTFYRRLKEIRGEQP